MLRHICPQRTLARIRELLRCAKSDVGKVTVAVSGEWPRAAHSKALDHHFAIWQRRRLFRHVFGGLNCALCSFDCGIVLPGLCDEQLQTRWSVLRESRCGPENKHTDFADLRHFSSQTLEMKCMRRHNDALALQRRRRNQILSTMTICGGLSGGHSNEVALLRVKTCGSREAASLSPVTTEPKSFL